MLLATQLKVLDGSGALTIVPMLGVSPGPVVMSGDSYLIYCEFESQIWTVDFSHLLGAEFQN